MLVIAYEWCWSDHVFLYVEEYWVTQLQSSDPHLLSREKGKEKNKRQGKAGWLKVQLNACFKPVVIGIRSADQRYTVTVITRVDYKMYVVGSVYLVVCKTAWVFKSHLLVL